MRILFNLIFCLILCYANGETFSSIVELEKLAEADKAMIEQLRNFSLRVNDDYVNK